MRWKRTVFTFYLWPKYTEWLLIKAAASRQFFYLLTFTTQNNITRKSVDPTAYSRLFDKNQFHSQPLSSLTQQQL